MSFNWGDFQKLVGQAQGAVGNAVGAVGGQAAQAYNNVASNINQKGTDATNFGKDIRKGIQTGNWSNVGNDINNSAVAKVDPQTGNKTLVTGDVLDKNGHHVGFDQNQVLAAALSFSGDTATPEKSPYAGGLNTIERGGPGPKINVGPKRPTTPNPYSYTPNGQPSEVSYGPPTSKLPPISTSPVDTGANTSQLPTVQTTQPFTPQGPVDTANIAKIQAKNAASNSTARTFTTPDIQNSYIRNGISSVDDVAQVKKSLYDNIINPDLASNPIQVPLRGSSTQPGIIDKVITRMQELDPSMSPQDAQDAANKIINRLQSTAQQEQGGLEPNVVSMKAINDESRRLSDSTAVTNYYNGIMPSDPNSTAIVAAKEVLRGTVSSNNPIASQAIRDYGNLEEGFPSYSKARDTADAKPTPDSPLTSAIKTGLKIGGAGVGIASGLAGYTILNSRQKDQSMPLPPITPGVKSPPNQTAQNQEGNGYIDHTSTSIPQSMEDISKSQNKDGTYNVVDPTNIKGSDGESIVINKNDFNQQYSQLNTQISQLQARAKAEQTTNPIQADKDNGAAIALQGQQSSLVNKMNQSGQINDMTQKTVTLNKVMADAQKRLAAGANDPSLTNLLSAQGMSLDTLAQTQNGKYSQLAKELKYIEESGGGTIFVPGSQTSVLQGNLDLANKELLNAYYNQINQYTGGSTTQVNPTKKTAPTKTPPLPPIETSPQGTGDMTTGTKLTPLNQPI